MISVSILHLKTKITVRGNRSRDKVTDCNPMDWIAIAQLR